VDVDYPPEAEAFRMRIRAFLAEQLPADWPGAGALPPDERRAFARRWRHTLADRGLVAVSWPKEYGGAGLTAIEQVVLAEEFARAGAPERAENDLLGIDLLGNTLIALGFEEQKKHFLPRILTGEDRWCQGFSEPEAGSDLAAVRTRAVLDSDEWVINGQKIWTSAGPTANWIFLLARTDPAASKHSGLSFLLVPMDQPGVEVRPIVNAAGHASFSEVFLTDARTPAVNVVGGVGHGWSTAMTLLGFERGSQVTTAAIDFGRDLDRLRELARERGLHTDPHIRDALAWCFSRVQIMRYRGYRALTSMLDGGRPGADAAITKVIWSEYFRRYTELAVEILGLEVLGPQGPGNGAALMVPEAGTPNSAACWMDELLYARAATIYAGSSQIQRNVIGERLLGLPKEPNAPRPSAERIAAFALSSGQN
jgi:alkylation response protein AidB-like acyl-CoA dehydrogenase